MTPLKTAQEMKSLLEGEDEGKIIEKRVFVLTDGQCSSKSEIYEQCR